MRNKANYEYRPQEIEPRWRERWEESGAHKAPDLPGNKNKFYCLDMFPYPSGAGLHVGHWRGYVLSDVVARYRRCKGDVVLHPMGWDAFGLPAENDAIKKRTHPRTNTQCNIDNIRRQLKEIGAMYDWSREFATTDPEYYRWTQWIFLRMFKRGLAYQDNIPINWCPSCRCGLANEEVVGGNCERCGAETEKSDRTQWLMRITDYAERLLTDLDDLDWPEKVKTMQRNWIGRSEGAEITFTLLAHDESEYPINVFTTRPDTLWGATYLVLAPEHPLAVATAAPEMQDKVKAYAVQAGKLSDIDRTAAKRSKTGLATGIFALNPVNGQKIPVWVSDYVLITYGTGAIMAVPAHDERDFEFATQFGIPIIEVIKGDDAVRDADGKLSEAYTGEGTMVNSAGFDGTPSLEGKRKVTRWLEEKGLAESTVKYRIRDWVYSRQRYWGEPIPIINCPKCGNVAVPDEDLPVLLPDVEHYEVSGTGDSPLATITEWVNTTCPKCGGPAKRETDTMPQWAGSSWYFFRYVQPRYDQGPFDPEAVENWLPVDMYVGGIEHAILHLLYARFFVKVLYDEGLISFKEPFKRLFNQGMICKESYRCNPCRKWFKEEDIKEGNICPECGKKLIVRLDKMSKSKENYVLPDDLVNKYGADSLRIYELFVGPPEIDAQWTTNGIEGCWRFLRRFFAWVHRCAPGHGSNSDSDLVARARHLLAKTITKRLEGLRFNTCISAFMEFINAVENVKIEDISNETLKTALICLSPFAPHITEELWHTALGEKETIFNAGWPEWDEELTKPLEIEMPVQVNGKLMTTISVPADIDNDSLQEKALAQPRVQQRIGDKTIKRVIIVPKRIVNVVVVPKIRYRNK